MELSYFGFLFGRWGALKGKVKEGFDGVRLVDDAGGEIAGGFDELGVVKES